MFQSQEVLQLAEGLSPEAQYVGITAQPEDGLVPVPQHTLGCMIFHVEHHD
jgi:hypothetical protein